MGYRSNVAFSFTKENWDKLCELAKTDRMALSERFSFEDLVSGADIEKEIVDAGEILHVVCWNWMKWNDNEGDAIEFFEEKGRPLAYEYIRIGEEDGDVDMDIVREGRAWGIEKDGIDIIVNGVTLNAYQRENLLKDVVKAFKEAAPEAAEAFYKEHWERLVCDEYDKLFGKKVY